jgi:hypothetical protein
MYIWMWCLNCLKRLSMCMDLNQTSRDYRSQALLLQASAWYLRWGQRGVQNLEKCVSISIRGRVFSLPVLLLVWSCASFCYYVCVLQVCHYITVRVTYSHVYGFGVTNNNGIWIWWLSLLGTCLQLQPIIRADTFNSFWRNSTENLGLISHKFSLSKSPSPGVPLRFFMDALSRNPCVNSPSTNLVFC